MKEQINQRKRQMIGLRISQEIQEHGLTNEEIAEEVNLSPIDISQVRKGQAAWLDHEHLRDLDRLFHLSEGRRGKSKALSNEEVEQLFLGELPYAYKF